MPPFKTKISSYYFVQLFGAVLHLLGVVETSYMQTITMSKDIFSCFRVWGWEQLLLTLFLTQFNCVAIKFVCRGFLK